MLLLATFVSGCSKDEPTTPSDNGDSNSISFSTEAIWTRGTNINGIGDIDALNVYSYYIKDKVWENASKDDLKPYFTSDMNTPFVLHVADNGKGTYEGGTRYWPTIDGVKLSFFTYYPESDFFVPTYDESTGKPTYKYTSSQQVQDNHDLVYSAKCDLTVADNNNSPKVTFDLKHLLSKLSIKVKTSNSYDEDASLYNVSYKVNGVTISNLYPEADIEVGVDNALQLDTNAELIEMTASQSYTFLSVDDDPKAELYENPNQGSDGYTDIMSTDKAIFVLPQGVGTDARGADNAPKIRFRILKRYTLTEEEGAEVKQIAYETKDIVIPAATGSNGGWAAGSHYGLLFDFDLSKLDEQDTPLTVRSVIYDWTEATVDVDVHKNTYIYSSDNLIEVPQDQDYAEMVFLTNYEYDLRRYCRKYELDGTPSEAHGFMFYAVNNTPTDSDSWVELTDVIHPVMLWNGDATTFNQGTFTYAGLTEYPFSYDADGTLYVGGTTDSEGVYLSGGTAVKLDADGHADPAPYLDSEGYMYFVVKPDPFESSKNFYYKVKRTTRKDMHLYTNTSISESSSYGVNKNDDDAVYILRLDINTSHLQTSNGLGYFYGKIGTEMLSNGGGIITNKFKITLKKTL